MIIIYIFLAARQTSALAQEKYDRVIAGSVIKRMQRQTLRDASDRKQLQTIKRFAVSLKTPAASSSNIHYFCALCK